MKLIKTYRILFILLIVVANIGCDQVSKSIVREHVASHETIPLINEHFLLTKVENSGAFLSVGDELPPMMKTIALVALPIVTLFGMLGWLFFQRLQNVHLLLGMSSVIGGGIGNIFDRLMYGSVTDFLYIDLGFVHTGVFNMADVSITGGVTYLIVYQLFSKRTEPPVLT